MCIQTVHEQLRPSCFTVIIVYTVTREQTLAEAYKQKYREDLLFCNYFYGLCRSLDAVSNFLAALWVIAQYQ